MSENKYVVQSEHFEVCLDNNTLKLVGDKLNIPYGKFVIIEGKNGIGKSTFLKFLSNTSPYYYFLDKGTIAIYEKNINDLKIGNALQRKVTYISQGDEFEKGSSVYHALTSSTLTAINNEKEFSLKKKELKNKCKELAFNYYHEVVSKYIHKKGDKIFTNPENDWSFMYFKRVSSLSGGQQKMVHLLQGFIKVQTLGINLLLLDEPLNNLDKDNKIFLIRLITKLREANPNLTILTISHCRLFPNIDGIINIKQSDDISLITYEDANNFSYYDCLKE